MKKKLLHSVFSVIVSILIVLPFAIQTIHALEGHKHTICTAKKIKHFHKQEIDCSIYHQIIEHNSIDFSSEFSLEIIIVYQHYTIPFYQSQYSIFLKQKSPRAPPHFIV